MKRVLLMGDSIRIGYQNEVKELLKNECEVVFWDDNSRFIQYHYWQLNQIFRHSPAIDIVHFNSGYWDMNIESPMKEALNPIDEYCYGLEKVIKLIQSQKAIPIFANTVPIYRDGQGIDNTGIQASFTYKNEWVLSYNKAAEKVMKAHNIFINDLYSLLLKGDNYFKCPDGLHLSEEGNHLCALQVVSTIRRYL